MSNENKPLKVMCRRSGCLGTVAHIYGDNMVSVKRSKNIIQNLGRDYNMLLSCPFKDCMTTASIICENGKIKLENLNIAKEEPVENLVIKPKKDGEQNSESEE